jgi:hypothetical protein
MKAHRFFIFLLLRYDYRREKLLKVTGYYWSNYWPAENLGMNSPVVAHAAEGD